VAEQAWQLDPWGPAGQARVHMEERPGSTPTRSANFSPARPSSSRPVAPSNSPSSRPPCRPRSRRRPAPSGPPP
jgi:hypothetical protein